MKRAGIKPALPCAKRWLVAFLGLGRRLRAALHGVVRLRRRRRGVRLGGQALARTRLRAACRGGARARVRRGAAEPPAAPQEPVLLLVLEDVDPAAVVSLSDLVVLDCL